MKKVRDYRYDHMRLVLMILVVLGHFMELFQGVENAYKVIYLFHMPAFIFLTGCFARFDPKKIMKKFILPYFLFQTLFQVFLTYIMAGVFSLIHLQFTTPLWVYWYLVAIIFYYLLLPMFPAKTVKNAMIMIGLSGILSLAAGYGTTIGRYLSLQRAISFFPFFVLGYYFPTLCQITFVQKMTQKRVYLVGVLPLTIGLTYYRITKGISKAALYCSGDYVTSHTTVQQRLMCFGIAFMWIWMLLLLMPKKEIKGVTLFGQNTMPIFLCHCFVVKYAAQKQWFHYTLGENIVLMFLLTIGIVLVFGYPYDKINVYSRNLVREGD